MKNIYLLILSTTFFSCLSQEKQILTYNNFSFNDCSYLLKNDAINSLHKFSKKIESKKTHRPHEVRLDKSYIKSMLSTFNKQLNTKVFSNICEIEQLSFSLGKQKYKGVITDIFYVQNGFLKEIRNQ